MRATEILAEVEAERKLLEIGWEKVICENCKGTRNDPILAEAFNGEKLTMPCGCCSNGFIWKNKDGRVFKE